MDKKLKKQMINIALPIMLQSLILSLINLTDVFMIGRIGEVEIASVGLSNQILFLFMLFCMGINNAGAIFVAQYFGRGERNKIKVILAISLIFSLLLASTFALMASFFPDKLMNIYTKDPLVVEAAVPYLKIVAVSYIFTGLTIVYSTLLRSMGNTKMAMYASIIALIFNVTFNYILIFGKLGFPRLEVSGAAIATTIARFLEISTIFIVSKRRNYDIFLKLNNFKEISIAYLKDFFIKGLPVIGSHVIWSVGATTLFVIYGHVGTKAVTAMNISGSIERIAFIAIVGVGSAVGVIVGQELGKGNHEKAYHLSKEMLRLNAFLAFIIGIILFSLSGVLVEFYNIPDDIKRASANVIKILGLILPIRALNFTNMVGILRAGGDTGRILLIDILAMWGTSIPMAYIGYKMGFPVYLVFLMAASEEITKVVGSMHRFISKKWINTLE